MSLATVFLARVAERTGENGDQLAGEFDLEARLLELWKTGTKAWPGVEHPLESFVSFLAERVTRSEDLALERAADWYIACACAAAEERAISALEARFFPDLERALARLRLDHHELAEAKQKLRSELFVSTPDGPAKIASYAGRGELAGWLRVTALRSALKLRRGKQRERPLQDEDLLAKVKLDADTPDVSYIKALYRPAFKQAFDEALNALSAREQNLLRQHYLDGLSTEQLGKLYQVHKATAARWLIAAREELAKRALQNFCRRVQIPSHEVTSVLRLIESQLEVTLREQTENR